MILEVNPNRMELLRLRKKLTIARRGHKLLKDKLEELIRILITLVKEVEDLYDKVDQVVSETRDFVILSEYSSFPEAVMLALSSVNDDDLEVVVQWKHVLNLKIPHFEIKDHVQSRNYGFAQTSGELDHALENVRQVLKIILELAEKEKSIYLITGEIKKTKRRVNALEYILIPKIEETIRWISMKMEEEERNTKSQLMRIKDVIRLPLAHSSYQPGIRIFPL